MSKTMKTALALVLTGIIICIACITIADFDFTKLSTVSAPTALDFEFNTNDVAISSIHISLSTDDVDIIESEDNFVHVKLYKYDYEDEKVEVSNGVLEISKDKHDIKSWININFNRDDYTSVVSVPKDFDGDISISLSTGDIYMGKLSSLKRVSVSLSTGNTDICDSVMESLSLKCSTGKVLIQNVNIVKDADIKSSTGNCTLENVSIGGALTRNCSTGNTELNHLQSGSVHVDSTTGNIKMSSVDASDVSLTATTGNIRGTLKGSISDYTITSDTSTGNNSLPARIEVGDRLLNVKTSTGNIDIDFK